MLRVVLPLILICAVSLSYSQAVNTTDSFRLDPQIKKGILPNGFTYYIYHSDDANGKVKMDFIVKAGRVNENAGQAEMAHLLEHIALRQTKHFPGVKAFFQGLGAKMGNDFNGFTAHDNTSYFFTIPATKDNIEKGLLLYRDFAADVILDDENIEAEASVVRAEIRTGAEKDKRMENKYLEQFPPDCPGYFSAAGRDGNLQKNDHELLRKFYRDWYRPELQCIIVSGDIEVNAIERQIIDLFSSLKNPLIKPAVVNCVEDVNKPAVFFTATDPEQSSIELDVSFKKYAICPVTVNKLRELIVNRFAALLLSQRIKKLTDQYNSPFLFARSGYDERKYPGVHAIQVRAVLKGKPEDAVCNMYALLNGIQTYGFGVDEINNARKFLLTEESGGRGFVLVSAQCFDDFMGKGVAMDMDMRRSVQQEIIKSVGRDELNKCITGWLADARREVSIFAPEKSRNSLPDEKLFNAWAKGAAPQNFMVAAIPNINISLNDASNKKYSVSTINAINARRYRLDNGVTVILKPVAATGSKRIYMRAVSGVDNIHGECNALFSGAIVKNSGAGGLNKFQIADWCNATDFEVEPYVYRDSKGVVASAEAAALENMLKLIYAYFTTPQRDSMAFEDWKHTALNAASRQGTLFEDTVASLLKRYSLRVDSQQINCVQYARAFNAYRSFFSNAADFTFIFTGNFKYDSIFPLISRYISSLPAKGKRKNYVHYRNAFSLDPVSAVIPIDASHNQSKIFLSFRDYIEYNQRNVLIIKLLAGAFNIILTNRLREKDRDTYTVQVNARAAKYPVGNYYVDVSFIAASGNENKMIAAVKAEAESMARNGCGEDILGKVKLQYANQLKANMDCDNCWNIYLAQQLLQAEDYSAIMNEQSIIDTISNDDIRQAARYYLSDKKLSTILSSSELQ